MRAKILIVDDNHYDRELASVALRSLSPPFGPPECVGVADWLEARERLGSERFDLILLDYNLPMMSGLDILRELSEALAPPVVMLTGQDDVATAVDTLRAGARDYVPKAAGWGGTLGIVVERVLRRVQLEVELAEAQRRLGEHAAELERVVVDRTAVIRAQAKEIEQLFLKSEEAARLKQEIIANVSHELRTPLNVILGYLEVLRMESSLVQPEAATMLDKVHVQGVALHKLIESLLTLVRLRSHREGLELSTFRLAEVLEDLRSELSVLRTTARASSNLVVNWQMPPTAARVRGDRGKVRTIAYHLLQNAIKFAPQGTVSIELAATSDGGIAITARDDGIGFPDDLRAVAFEDFRQGDGSSTRRFEGLGIGLGIVRRYVEILNGTIDIDSAPGAGTTVVVTLAPPTAFREAESAVVA
jgi:signal transduction histidine kinase